MSAPWRQLKDAENVILSDLRRGVAASEGSWKRLRALFESCCRDTDADEVLCWHGAAAMLAERDGDFQRALKHRQIEIEKILWLQAEEVRNPTGGYQTQDYEESDLSFRREMVSILQNKLQSGG